MLEARAGNAGKGSDTAVLKVGAICVSSFVDFVLTGFLLQLEFEIKQLKKDLDEARENGGAELKSEVAKLKEELAKERARPKGGISKEDYEDLKEENADLESELQRTKVFHPPSCDGDDVSPHFFFRCLACAGLARAGAGRCATGRWWWWRRWRCEQRRREGAGRASQCEKGTR